MTKGEIIANVRLLIVAGSETTATLLSGLTYMLLTNPAAYERGKAEVRSAFSKPTDITFTSTTKLPYLHALIEEAFRLYPPVPTILPRKTGPKGDFINGDWVAPNVSAPITVPSRSALLTLHRPRWACPSMFATDPPRTG